MSGSGARLPADRPSAWRTWRFGPFTLDERERRLTAGDQVPTLSPKAFDLLVLLVERHGRLVRRDELMSLLWPDTFVEDGTLARHVSDVRKALGEASGMLRTVPKAGYRLVAEVEERIGPPEGTPPPEPGPPPRRWRGARPLAAVVLAILLALVGWQLVRRVAAPRPAPVPRSVAVLPFLSIGAAESDEHLEIGLADVLINRLSRMPELEVRPLAAVSRYTGANVDALAAGRALGVDAILEGTLRRSEDRLRVSARLLTVPEGRALWADSFDSADRDLLSVEEAIGRQAALALAPSLRAEPAANEMARGVDVDARTHDLYLRGRYFWGKRTSEGNRRAVELFEAALARAPDYAEAEAGLAAANALLAGLSEPPVLYEEARRHAARALALDASSADAHAVLGLVAENYDGDWARAEQEYRWALRLQPNHPTAHHWYGEMLALLGRFDEGIALLERAARLDPESLAIAADLAKAHYFARDWEGAIRLGEEVLAVDSRYAWAWAWVGTAELARGNAERSLECLRRFAELDASPFALATSAWAHAATGDRARAQAIRESLDAEARQGYVTPVALAMARLAVGDEERALDALDELVATRQNRVGISTSPLFDALRDRPRYRELLRRANLSPPPP